MMHDERRGGGGSGTLLSMRHGRCSNAVSCSMQRWRRLADGRQAQPRLKTRYACVMSPARRPNMEGHYARLNLHTMRRRAVSIRWRFVVSTDQAQALMD